MCNLHKRIMFLDRNLHMMELFEDKPTKAYKCCSALSTSLPENQICEYEVIVCYISFLNLPPSMPVLYTIM